MGRKMGQIRYCVFELVDPRDDQVFWVGSGRVANWKGNALTPRNSMAKANKISSIRSAGHDPVARIVQRCASKETAIKASIARHRELGLKYNGTKIALHSSRVGRARAWCGYPEYDRVCRFLPVECVPRDSRSLAWRLAERAELARKTQEGAPKDALTTETA